MDPVLRGLLLSWELRPVFILFLLTLAILYTIGWTRLRRKSVNSTLANRWRLTAYWVAFAIVIIALMSPIDILGAELFYFHMIQHLLLTMIAAPLVMLANPMPFIMWGLPRKPRKRFGRMIAWMISGKESLGRKILRQATKPGVCWFIMLALLWIWHEPPMYNLALRNEFWHDIEHIAFFWSAILYWWHAIGAAPHIHPKMARIFRVGYLFGGIPVTFILGVKIAFATGILYTYYETRPRLPVIGLSVADDQILGGIIMWVPGSMMYFAAALVLVARWMQEQQNLPPVPDPEWLDRGEAAK